MLDPNPIQMLALEPTSAASVEPKTADPTDVEVFEAFLNAPEAPLNEVPLQIESIQQNTSIGDHFWNGIDAMNRSHGEQVDTFTQAVNAVSNVDEIAMQDMLKVQFELANLSFQEQLTVKLVDKTSEGFKTLFKNQ